MKNYLLKITRFGWILIIIIVVGFSLRAYQHYNFLRFNPDQARDASLVRDVVSGEKAWPLLGPQAGGTNFRLGGAFYQIEILSAQIFGESPDRLAFPDLFFSILSIPLLYFFLRKFFDEKISLASCALLAVSFYAVKYARFAWNPNSTPFYVLLFLYSLNEIATPSNKKKWLWALLAGVSAGIGVQLHSLLLFSFPVVFLAYFTYLFFKKNPAWKWAPAILLIGLFLNTPQIISEVQTGGKNTQAFFQGMNNKSARGGNLAQKFILNTTCHIQANSFMLLPIGNDSQCDFADASANFQKNEKKAGGKISNLILVGDILFALVFSLGGYWLFFKNFQKEKDENRKRFLGLILLYVGTLFVFLIPLADEISFRFFLVLEFMPFLLFGFWLKFLNEYFASRRDAINRVSTTVAASVAIAIIAVNVFYLTRNFSYLAGNIKEGSNGFEEITLGEVRYMADFIVSRSDGVKKIYLRGKASELFEITKPIKYFTDPSGLKVNNFKKGQVLMPGEKVFLIDVVKNPAGKNSSPEGAVDTGSFNRIMIYEMGE